MKIALVSDTHFDSADTLLIDNWAAVEHWLDAVSPDLIIHLGDITADGVHKAGELQIAYHLVHRCGKQIRCLPGNHDIGEHDPGPDQSTHDPFDLDRLADYRRIFGPDRWAVSENGWQFIGINAPLMATGTIEEAEQDAWLHETLLQQDGPVGLFLHKPLFRNTPEENIIHTRYVPASARPRLLSLLGQRDLRFVAAGHTHQVRQFTCDRVEHIWVPSTAFTICDKRQERIGEKLVGVMLLEIDAHRQHFTHVIPSGMKSHTLVEFAHVYPALKANPGPDDA